MTEEHKHTPLPWIFQENRSGMISNDVVPESGGNTIAAYTGKEDAAFIVKACNVYYENEAIKAELLAALEVCIDMRKNPEGVSYQAAKSALAKADAAITRAKGGVE